MKSEITLRRMRNKIFDYTEEKAEQADKVLSYLKKRFIRERDRLPSRDSFGLYSGLTKRELRLSGTCETDWI